ncbi:MAG: endo alpha-1,4 polygalactosaminidase [Umezawaea sp.]
MAGKLRPSLGVAAVALGLVACSVQARPAEVGEVSVPVSAAARTFPDGAAADYQLGGAYPPPVGVALVVRDSTEAPAEGLFNVCYVNGFQTQPAEREVWLSERRDLVLSGKDGQPVIDPNWPDEMVLDTSTVEKRARLAVIVGATIQACDAAGFDAVEVDNLDSDTRSRGALTVENNLAFAALLVGKAHDRGLLIGQKNAAGLGQRGKEEVGFDFAVAEECLAFDECGAYTAVYGQRVLDVEYTDNLPSGGVCGKADRPRATIVRDRSLVRPGAPGYSYQRC